MSSDFFDKPFNQETNVKLELYREYLMGWLPVFVSSPKPFRKRVNIFDFFCGPGSDAEGTYGSPLIALDVLNQYKDFVVRDDIEIHLHFNDANPEYIEQLKNKIAQFPFEFDHSKIRIHYYTKDFEEVFYDLLPLTRHSANLIFLDQFGIKYVTEDRFKILIELPVTDLLFFISSSTFNRFPDDENVTRIIGLNSEEIRAMPFYEIHRLVHRRYSDMIPERHSYCLAPFSIKKGANIYGLIFGSGHPLGLEKFLDICWKKDAVTGEANFDIQGDLAKTYQPSLFEEDEPPSKIEQFESDLKQEILSGSLRSDRDVFLYMINHGFIGTHVRPVVNMLKAGGQIKIKHPSFKCSTVWDYKREPKTIEVV